MKTQGNLEQEKKSCPSLESNIHANLRKMQSSCSKTAARLRPILKKASVSNLVNYIVMAVWLSQQEFGA